MITTTLEQLHSAKCTPCEGGIEPISASEAFEQLKVLENWKLAEDGKSISKSWNCKDFLGSLDFALLIGRIAEAEQHHPDLHLTGYRHLKVVLTTHAVGGLSMNDFVLAAKIDAARSSPSLGIPL